MKLTAKWCQNLQFQKQLRKVLADLKIRIDPFDLKRKCKVTRDRDNVKYNWITSGIEKILKVVGITN